mmetsp:Transcript_668/g.1306  ORF Transcript_668/g.1306 Transcript_668/m.1306 type:complete len:146 (-) Transcript_668:124-561(-)
MGVERSPQAGTIDDVHGQVQEAMAQMRDNMRAMAERDSQLNNLVSRTQDLQGASSAFSQSSRQLQANYQWQRCRLYLLVATLVSWVPVFFIRRSWIKWWAPASLALFGAVVLLRGCLLRQREQQYTAAIHRQGYSAELQPIGARA